jgi:hypothetical protein
MNCKSKHGLKTRGDRMTQTWFFGQTTYSESYLDNAFEEILESLRELEHLDKILTDEELENVSI